MSILPFRVLGNLLARSNLAQAAGLTYEGARDPYVALGYKKELSTDDYWLRYERNSVAGRVVEAYPNSTWRGMGELIEKDDPKVTTPFEEAWNELNTRLKIWPSFLRLDVLAGIGRFGVLLIGAPGKLDTPLPKPLSPEQVAFLTPFSEKDVAIDSFVSDTTDPRYGMPLQYSITNIDLNRKGASVKVHWTRVTHVADGALDSEVYGRPRLKRVWNNLDDLDKVVGAGAEAFWLRAHQGYQFDVDKETRLDPEGEAALKDEVDEFINGIKRAVKTRGVKLTTLGSDVANFDSNVASLISLISSGTGIPQRILMGSERGQLASQQDRVNWAERIQDRRTEFAGPYIVRPLVDRFIEYSVLPTPEEYTIRWPQIFDLSDDERAKIANQWVTVNQKNKDTGGMVITQNEIRDRVLGMEPLTKEQVKEAMDMAPKPPPPPPGRLPTGPGRAQDVNAGVGNDGAA